METSHQDLSKKVCEMQTEHLHLETEVTQIRSLIDSNLLDRVKTLEVKMQNTLDLTDDLISNSANSISAMEAKSNTAILAVERALETSDRVMAHADRVLSQAGVLISHADAAVSTYLIWTGIAVTIVVALVTIFVNYVMSKKREDYIKSLVEDLTAKFGHETELGQKLAQRIADDENFMQNLSVMINSAVQEKTQPSAFSNMANKFKVK